MLFGESEIGMDTKRYQNTVAQLEAMRMARAAARTSGATQVTSLELARVRVAKAEAELESARAVMRTAAKAAGVKLGGIFAESLFVSRATSERWADEARDEGRAEMTAAYRMLLAPPSPELAALGDAVRKAIAAGGFKDILGKDKGGAPADAAADLAQQILAAAERARSDGSNERPEPAGLAGKIVAAGKARRVPFGDDK
jgi:hypothetical protein